MKKKYLIKSLSLFCSILISLSAISQNTFPSTGYVGIETTSPKSQLQIGDYSRIATVSYNTYISRGWYFEGGTGKTNDPNPSVIGIQNNGIAFFADANIPLNVAYSPTTRMFIQNNGNVGIGTSNPGPYKLAVEGKIGAREIKVTLANPWADYVFDPSYQLRSLYDVEKFVQLNKHLPNIPSASEVKEAGGVELGNMNVKLLEKVEELTLYVIQLKKENDKIKEQLEKIQKKR